MMEQTTRRSTGKSKLTEYLRLQTAVIFCISVCACSGNQGQLPSTSSHTLSVEGEQLVAGTSLTVTPGCLHFTRLGTPAEHSLYVTPTVSTVLKATSSNPKQAAISPSAVNATAHHTYAFAVDPLTYGHATLTISNATGANHISETANAPNLYVADYSTSKIVVFPADATGDVTPSRVISGSRTGLVQPVFLANDCNGNIYVANLGAPGSITRYPASANGNVSPTQAIADPEGAVAVALDSAGRIFEDSSAVNKVSVYSPNANGNAAPLYTIPTTGGAHNLAIDDQDQLYIANTELSINSGASSIMTYSPTTSGRPPTLLRTIVGSATHLVYAYGLAISRHHYIWTVDLHGSPDAGVWVFAPGANGNATPTGTISGPNTRLGDADGIAFDSDENRYITGGQSSDNGAILKFSPSQNGNVAPVGQIAGPRTQLVTPGGILVY